MIKRSWGFCILFGLCVIHCGCEPLEPAASKANSGISKSGAPSSGGPQVWTKQSAGGFTFTAPFEVKMLSASESPFPADARSQFTHVEDYAGTFGSADPDKQLRLVISRVQTSSDLSGNMESAMRRTITSAAQKLGDPNPVFTLVPTQFGGANGFVSSYAFQSADGKFSCFESINAAFSGNYLWVIQAGSPDPKLRDMAKQIIASVTIQP